MKIPIVQVDAFTSEPFRGNPACVCLLDEEPPEARMQAIAAEANQSETAFLVRRPEGGFSIRWFTPSVEVPLCGHATLASAHVLWEDSVVAPTEPIILHAQSGVLRAAREAPWIQLDFPALPVKEVEVPSGLGDALGAEPLSVHQNQLTTFLVELDSAETVRKLQPDMPQIRDAEFNVCIVTARSDSPTCDFVSRFFAPGIGIDEDPVTGAAHCSLGPFWADRLGKTELVGHQVSKRGGVVKVRVRRDRVEIRGQAVTVIRGELTC